MDKFDLNILPIHRRGGKDHTSLVGLHAAAPPRRAARGRKTDQLILLLSFNGPPPFGDERIAELVSRLVSGFYDTPGSLTAASREIIEELNGLLLNINQRGAGTKEQISGSISVLVVHNDHLYLAQSGQGHLFVLMPRKVDYIHDEKAAGPGLGLNRTASIHFAQLQLKPGYRLLFTPKIPDTWTSETFQEAHNQLFHTAQRCFLQDSGDDVSAALVDVLAGSGAVNLLRAAQAPQVGGSIPIVEPTQIEEEKSTPQDSAWDAVQDQSEAPPVIGEQREEPPADLESYVPQTDSGYPPPASEEPHPKIPVYRSERQARPAKRKSPLAEYGPAILGSMRKLRASSARAFKGLTNFFQRILPWDEMAQIPTSYAAFIAVAVPLIVITVAALVYVQVGKTQQFEYYLEQAQSHAQIAIVEEDPNIRHQAWTNALALVESAESYYTTDDSNALHLQAVEALDDLDGITRLEFTPAIAGSMASSIKIRRMIATNNEIYMLDIEHDQIYRARLVGNRYEIDPDFRCSRGRYGTLNVEGLLDIVALPKNPEGATVLAVDAGGNLLYCYPDRAPIAIEMVPPDNYFSDRIVGITLENENLYILDEGRNMVWYYTPTDDNYQYREAPYFFFQDEVPDMLNTIDFAVDREQLYLLYNHWTTTTCTYSTLEAALTTCQEPEEYTDNRPGRESGPVIDGAVFYQVQHTQPPEPSLYYLDPVNRSVYHFSLRLNLVQQYRPQTDLEEGLITAFAISPSRHLFIALDNKVFISALP
jgi:hypothetical protein